jgi:hypothetical protein
VLIFFPFLLQDQSETDQQTLHDQNHRLASPRIGRLLSFDPLRRLSLHSSFLPPLDSFGRLSKLADRHSDHPVDLDMGIIGIDRREDETGEIYVGWWRLILVLQPQLVVAVVWSWTDGGDRVEDTHAYLNISEAALTEYVHEAVALNNRIGIGDDLRPSHFKGPFLELIRETKARDKRVDAGKKEVAQRLNVLAQIFDRAPKNFRLKWRREFQSDERQIDSWLEVRHGKLAHFPNAQGHTVKTMTEEQLLGRCTLCLNCGPRSDFFPRLALQKLKADWRFGTRDLG